MENTLVVTKENMSFDAWLENVRQTKSISVNEIFPYPVLFQVRSKLKVTDTDNGVTHDLVPDHQYQLPRKAYNQVVASAGDKVINFTPRPIPYLVRLLIENRLV